MENENIAAAAVNVQQARTHSQNAISTLKQGDNAEKNVADSTASSAGRVGDVFDPSQAVTQTSRLLDQYA